MTHRIDDEIKLSASEDENLFVLLNTFLKHIIFGLDAVTDLHHAAFSLATKLRFAQTFLQTDLVIPVNETHTKGRRHQILGIPL